MFITEIKTIVYTKMHFEAVFEMARKLFTEQDEELLRRDLTAALKKETHRCFLALQGETICGFSICSLRSDYVEGSSSSPTGYLEVIYVHENARGKGAAKLLVKTCEHWLSEKGCTEMGSDTWLDRKEAQLFHEAMGFKEEDRLVHYIKKI